MTSPPPNPPHDPAAPALRPRRWSAWVAGFLAAALLAVALHRLTGRPKPASGQGLDGAPQSLASASIDVRQPKHGRSSNRPSEDAPSAAVDQTESPPTQPSSDGAGRADPSPDTTSPPTNDPIAARQHELILGRWTRDYYGKWLLTIEPGGAGTMTVEPDRLWALIIGPRVTIAMKWRLENGHAVFDTLSGEPPAAFDAAMKLWKKHQERKIVELTAERFVYLSDDGKSNSVWLRAPTDEATDEKKPESK